MAYIRGTPPPPPWVAFIKLIMVNRDDKAFTVTTFEVKTVLRACLHGGRGPQDGDPPVHSISHMVTLTITLKRDQIKMRDYMDGYLTYLESPTSM